MVNSALLDEKIEQSGLKVTYIVDTLGISRQAFYKKKNGKTPFRKSEIYVTPEQRNRAQDAQEQACGN